MEPFPDKDVAVEVLSRLPAKSLMAFNCTAKRWNDFISDPSFLRIHDERSKNIMGLFVQQTIRDDELDPDMINLLTLTQTGFKVENTVLDFLPEKVILISSSNGILCCRSCVYPKDNPGFRQFTLMGLELESSQKYFALYICNVATKEWIQLRPKGNDVTLAFGLAFYPFCSSSGAVSRFKLVNLRCSRSNPNTYSFAIYSSETHKWKTSKEVCEFSSYIYPIKVFFSNGRLHWLTSNHHIVTFHVEKELCKVMKLPGTTPYEGDRCSFGICFGESEGYFHYVCAFETELHIWVLKDYEESTWELKHCLDLAEFCEQHSSLFEKNIGIPTYPDTFNLLNGMMDPLAFYDDVLYMRMFSTNGRVISYDFKTGTLVDGCASAQLGEYYNLHPIVLPYRVSLSPLPPGYLRVRRFRRNRR